MRTKEQVSAEMDGIQASLPELAKLNSTSQVSFYKLLKNMWLLLTLALEQRWDAYKADLVKAVSESQIGTVAWYAKTIKAFQFGDPVTVYDSFRVGYPVVDPAKQIIKQVAVIEENDGRLLVKVAKSDGGLANLPLTDNELNALKEYVRLIKYAGTAVDVISLPADSFKLEATVKYDRQVMGSDGKYLTNPTPFPVLESIMVYIALLPFDAIINATALTDHLQKLSGVLDFQIEKMYIRPNGATTWTEFTRETSSRAGHLLLSVGETVIKYV